MFSYIRGTVEDLSANEAVLDVMGMGFQLRVTAYTAGTLHAGTQAKLYTYLYIRDDLLELYGFATKSEKHCFEALLGVSGVGPKAALSVLSTNSPEGLMLAVASGDEKAILAAAGVGKKLAQRIILELKDKLSREVETVSFADAVPSLPLRSGKRGDAMAALSVLGYSAGEIHAALKHVDVESLSLEDIIKAALRQITQG